MKKSGTNRGVLLFLGLLVIMVFTVFIGTEFFLVESIEVTGNTSVDDEIIIRMSGININDNIFKINKRVVRERLEGNPPYFILESVSLKLPNKVVISVIERTPAAVIPYLSSYIVIDRNGFIMDIIKQKEDISLPVIEGIRIKSMVKGRPLQAADSDSYRFRAVISFLAALYSQDAADIISVINIEDADNIVLKSVDGIDIIVGQAVDLDKKVSWLKSDAYRLIKDDYSSGVFNISVKEPIFIKPKDDVEDETAN